MVLQPPQAAATARAITAYIVARVRVAGGPAVDAVLTSMQPSGELAARLRHTMYEATLTAHLSLMQQDTPGALPWWRLRLVGGSSAHENSFGECGGRGCDALTRPACSCGADIALPVLTMIACDQMLPHVLRV